MNRARGHRQLTLFAAVHESAIGTFGTSRDVCYSVANRGKPDMARTTQFGRE